MNRPHNLTEIAEHKKHANGRRRVPVHRLTLQIRERIVRALWTAKSSGKVADSHNVERAGVIDEAVITLRREQLNMALRLDELERKQPGRAEVIEMPRRVRFARAIA